MMLDFHFELLRYERQSDGRWRAEVKTGKATTMVFFTAERSPLMMVGRTVLVRLIGASFDEVRGFGDMVIPTLPNP